MANTLITSQIILNQAILELKNALTLAEKIDREYEGQFKGQSLKRGDTVNVRRRLMFKNFDSFATDGDITGQLQDLQEGSVPVRINHQPTNGFTYSSQDLTLEISDFSERFIRPCMLDIANEIDHQIAVEGEKFPTLIGTQNTPPTSFDEMGAISAKLDDYGCPTDSRCVFITPDTMVSLSSVLTTNFVTDIARRAIESNLVTMYADLVIYKNQNLVTHTTGSYGAAGAAISGAAQETTYAAVKDTDYLSQDLVITGLPATTTDAVKVGDTFEIAGVYSVNPRNRQSTGKLQNFTVTANADSDGAGTATLNVVPAIIPVSGVDGAYGTVYLDASYAGTLPDATAIVFPFLADTVERHNLAMHKKAMTLVCVPPEPFAGNVDNSTGSMDGIGMRVALDSNIITDTNTCRIDTLFGVKMLEWRAGVRQQA